MLSLSTDDMILYEEYSKDSTHIYKIVRTNKFSKVSGCKMNIKISGIVIH